MVRSSIISILLIVVASLAVQEAHSNRNSAVTALSIHEKAVQEVNSGKSLDSPVSFEEQGRFPKDWTSTGLPANNPDNLRPRIRLTYREAIGLTEDVLATSGTKVTVKISAAPGHCNVKYQPIIGGLVLDAGLTDTSKMLVPRWYVFSCDCATPPIRQLVDSTNDSTVSFNCPATQQVAPGAK
jgi:hypothetical protein